MSRNQDLRRMAAMDTVPMVQSVLLAVPAQRPGAALRSLVGAYLVIDDRGSVARCTAALAMSGMVAAGSGFAVAGGDPTILLAAHRMAGAYGQMGEDFAAMAWASLDAEQQTETLAGLLAVCASAQGLPSDYVGQLGAALLLTD